MKEVLTKTGKAELDREHDVLAAALSLLLPGMGHIYKGHVGSGVAILLIGVPFSLWIGLLLSLATLGFGMVIPVLFWALTAAGAYYAEDGRHHHVLNVF